MTENGTLGILILGLLGFTLTQEMVTLLEPSILNVKEYGSATFTCHSSNSSIPVVRYWWRINDVTFLQMTVNSTNCFNYHTDQTFLSSDSYNAVCDTRAHASLLLKEINEILKTLTCTIVTSEYLFPSNASFIHVLYPPKILAMSNVSLLEYSEFNISCDVNVGYPIQTTLKWTRDTDEFSSNGEQLLLTNVTRRDAALYTCAVNNTMTPTYGEISYGRDNRSFYLDVLYPPRVFPLRNVSVIEKSVLNTTCEITAGYPSETTVIWTRDIDNIISFRKRLELQRLSRKDSTWYTCTANNTMNPTNGMPEYGESSSSFFLDIFYPPKILAMSNVSLLEYSEFNISCDVNVGYPIQTTLKWTRDTDDFSSNGEQLHLKNVTRRDAAMYTCTVNNTMTPTYGETSYGRDNRSFYLDVLYPPSVQEMIDIIAIENHTVEVKCPVSSSKSTALSVRWLKDGNVLFTNDTFYISDISRDQAGNYTCVVNNTFIPTVGKVVYGKDNGTFTLKVAYPPRVFPLGNVSVIEKSGFSTTCEIIAGYPVETTVIWTRDIDNVISFGKRLELQRLSRKVSSWYTCTANNTMNPTNGTLEYGKNGGSFFLDILFPAVFKHPLRNTSVVEGDNLTVTCEASFGNPQETFYNWTRNGVLISKTSDLKIPKVTRGDNSIYACTIYNIMTPSDGRTVIIPKTIKAKVTKFSANGKTGEVVISNGKSLSVECAIEGNPIADALLYRTIETDSDAVVLTTLYHNVTNATFGDAGVYVCTAKNNYTTKNASRREITVIVKGPPRPYTIIPNITKVYTALHGTADLYFKSHPYLDVIGATRFIWYNGTSHLHADDVRVKITTNYIQSDVVITDILESDFGKYWVEVINSVGTYTHLFELIEREPDISQAQASTSTGLVIGIALAGIIFGAGLVASVSIFHKRLYRKRQTNTDSHTCIKYYANVETIVGDHGEGEVSIYDRVMPLEDRGNMGKQELAYELLN